MRSLLDRVEKEAFREIILALSTDVEGDATASFIVELLTGSEGDAFSGSGRAEEDLLAITAVHPMRRSAVEGLLQHYGAGWSVVQDLLVQGRLAESRYEGDTFYLRRFSRS